MPSLNRKPKAVIILPNGRRSLAEPTAFSSSNYAICIVGIFVVCLTVEGTHRHMGTSFLYFYHMRVYIPMYMYIDISAAFDVNLIFHIFGLCSVTTQRLSGPTKAQQPSLILLSSTFLLVKIAKSIMRSISLNSHHLVNIRLNYIFCSPFCIAVTGNTPAFVDFFA